MDPYASVRQLSEEMKNPHLIETVLRIPPMTGKVLQTADINSLPQVFAEKMSGNIPTLDVAFDVSGIPLLLTRQSYVELRLKPTFRQQVQYAYTFFTVPAEFEYNRYLWPKLNIACVESVSASFSNFGMENPTPTILPYIQSFRFNEVMKVNTMRSWNPSYLTSITSDESSSLIYANRFLNIPINGNFSQTKHRSPYSSSLSHVNSNVYSWISSDLLVHIPLQDLLPVFQIPVIPLRQTNSSSFQLRLVLRSPRHMFFSARCFNPPTASSIMIKGSTETNNAAETQGLAVHQMGAVEIGGAPRDIADAVVGGGTRDWLLSLTNYPFAQATNINSFDVDFTVECELVLRALTTPLLNPLIPRFLEPFINEANEFIAQYNDIYTFSTIINWEKRSSSRFSFIIHQLFYNTTHLALIFVQGPSKQLASNEIEWKVKTLSGSVPVCNVASLFKHGHFYLQKELRVDNFNILLGSGQTALFDRPLSFEEMFAATEAALTKYDNNTMYGDLVSISSRFHEGDAMFLFDLTHARDSGYFIDTDNRVYIEGQVTMTKYAAQNTIAVNNPNTPNETGEPPEAPSAAVFNMRSVQEERIRAARPLPEEEPQTKAVESRFGPRRSRQSAGIAATSNPEIHEFSIDVDPFIARAMSMVTAVPTFQEQISMRFEGEVLRQQTEIVVDVFPANERYVCPVRVLTVFDKSTYDTGRTTEQLLAFVPDKVKLGMVRGPESYFSSIGDPIPTTTTQFPEMVNVSTGATQTTENIIAQRGGYGNSELPFAPTRPVSRRRTSVETTPGTQSQQEANPAPPATTAPVAETTVNVDTAPINVILGVIYRNTFSVLLDLDGTVIIQQS